MIISYEDTKTRSHVAHFDLMKKRGKKAREKSAGTETETREIKSRLVLHLNGRVSGAYFFQTTYSASKCKTKIIQENSRDSVENQIITRNTVVLFQFYGL